MVKFDAVYWQILDDVLQFYYLDDCDYQVKVGSRHKHFRLCLILTFTVELDKKSTHESTKYDRRVPQPWRVSVSPTHQFRL